MRTFSLQIVLSHPFISSNRYNADNKTWQHTLQYAQHVKRHSLLQEQNRDVAKKLGTATIAMFTLPIISFYIGFYYLFTNKADPTMWSGGLAVLMANVVIAGYVVSAFSEEEEEMSEEEKRMGANDAAGPRVGAFKQRTDWFISLVIFEWSSSSEHFFLFSSMRQFMTTREGLSVEQVDVVQEKQMKHLLAASSAVSSRWAVHLFDRIRMTGW